MLSYRRSFLLSQFLFIFCAFLILHIFYPNGGAGFIYMCSIWLIVTYAIFFIKEIKYAPSFNPFILLILVAIQYVGLNGISLASSIQAGDSIFFGKYIINNEISQGIVFLLLEHLLLFAGFYYAISKRENTKQDNAFIKKIRLSNIPYYKFAITIYILTLILRLINRAISLISISAVFDHIINEGQLVALMFLSYIFLKNGRETGKAKRAFWVIVVIEILFALGSGFKQPILMAVLPYLIYLTIAYKAGILSLNPKLIIKIGMLGCFIVFFVFPYISIFRDIAKREKLDWGAVPVEQVFSEYRDYILNRDETNNNEDMDYMMSRTGSVGCNSWSIAYAQQNGNYPRYYMYCLSAVVPRILWPDKPPYIIGQMMYNLARGNQDWETKSSAKTAFTIGFIGSSYFGLGLWGALILPLIAGLYCGWLWTYIRSKMYYNPIAIFIFYTMIIAIFKDFESFNDGGVIFYVYTLVYCLLLKLFPFSKYQLKYEKP